MYCVLIIVYYISFYLYNKRWRPGGSNAHAVPVRFSIQKLKKKVKVANSFQFFLVPQEFSWPRRLASDDAHRRLRTVKSNVDNITSVQIRDGTVHDCDFPDELKTEPVSAKKFHGRLCGQMLATKASFRCVGGMTRIRPPDLQVPVDEISGMMDVTSGHAVGTTPLSERRCLFSGSRTARTPCTACQYVVNWLPVCESFHEFPSVRFLRSYPRSKEYLQHVVCSPFSLLSPRLVELV